MSHEDISLETILAVMVHDVKNSLGLMNGQLDSLINRLPSELKEEVGDLVRVRMETARINNDLIHMLGLYRLRHQKLATAIEEVYLEDLFGDVVSRYQTTLDRLHIQYQLTIEPDAEVWFIDPILMEGLLSNVITNSIRYTKSRLTLHVSVTKDDWLRIEVSDDGDGYPEDMLNWKEDMGCVNFKTGSTGLGLFFNSAIAEMHENNGRKGYFDLDNDLDNGGAVFTLFVP